MRAELVLKANGDRREERGPQELVWGGSGLEPVLPLTSGAEQAGLNGAFGTVKRSVLFR